MLKSRKTLNKNKSSGFVLDQTTLGVIMASAFAVMALGLGGYGILSGSFDKPASATITTEQSTGISTSRSESYSTDLDSIDSSSSDSSPSDDVSASDSSQSNGGRKPISESNPVKEASGSNATVINAPITHDYLIVWGDTLSELAVSNDVPMSSLVDLNHIQNPDLIYAGDTMKIPN